MARNIFLQHAPLRYDYRRRPSKLIFHPQNKILSWHLTLGCDKNDRSGEERSAVQVAGDRFGWRQSLSSHHHNGNKNMKIWQKFSFFYSLERRDADEAGGGLENLLES